VTAADRLADSKPLGLPAKLALAGEVVSSYAVARRALRKHGIRGALATLRAAAPAPAGASGEVDKIAAGRRLGRLATRTLTALPADSRCLMSSLVLTRLLARRGIESDLVIAVEPGESFGAHAWVEHAGAPLLSPGVGGFEELVTL
jgi:Transglutaminase-like superfamily